MNAEFFVIFYVVCQQWPQIEGYTSATPPSVCPCDYRYDPVCGSDNVTYTNRCVLDCINNYQSDGCQVNEVYNSECQSLVCQDINLPVCTLDGVTYPNECELAVDNIRQIKQNLPIIYLAYRAACVGESNECTTTAAPVCGTDDVLYRNECVLNSTSEALAAKGLPTIDIKNNGACLDRCLCPDTEEPVCGSNGIMYNNICELECENEKLKYSNSELITVADESVCVGCVCTKTYEPVCGSDGRTYPNVCELECECRRRNNTSIYVVSDGVCSECQCTDDNDPVCGTDQKTYYNKCYLRYENEVNNVCVGIHSYGGCETDICDCGYCSNEYEPVCGSDMQTYWNSCWLMCASDCYVPIYNEPVVMMEYGACCNWNFN